MSKEIQSFTEVVDVLARVMKEGFDSLGARMDVLERRMDAMEHRQDRMESQMVTKDYLDRKIVEWRGDLIALTRKEDTKLLCVVDTLHTKQVFSQDDVRDVRAMEPFARPN